MNSFCKIRSALKTSTALSAIVLCTFFVTPFSYGADYEVAGANTATNGDGNPGALIAGDTLILLDGASISTTANSEYGVYFNPADGNVINNSGTITTQGDTAHGIYVVYDPAAADSVTINNTGTIHVNGAGSYGVWLDPNGFGGSSRLVNAGSIWAADENEIAISFAPSVSAGNNDELILLPGSSILGRIIMDGNGSGEDTVRIVSGGLAQRLTLEEFTHGAGDEVIVEGAPFFVETNAGNTTVTVADLSNPASGSAALPDLTRSVSAAVSGRIDAAWSACGSGFARSASGLSRNGCTFRRRQSGQSEAVTAYAPPNAENAANAALVAAGEDSSSLWQGWGKVFGGVKHRDASGTAGALRHGWAGFTLGADRVVTEYALVGGYVGYSRSMLDFEGAQSDIDSDVFFGGFYSRLINRQNVFADLDLGVGYVDGEPGTRLQVNNSAPTGFDRFTGAEASGLYVAPGLRVGAEIAASQRITLIPSARLSLAHQWRKGYTESGPTGAMTVEDHRIAVVAGRFELAARMSDVTDEGQVWGLELRGGLDVSQDVSEDVDFTFGGTGFSTNVGPDEMQLGGFIGASAVWGVSERLSLTLDSEFSYAENDAKEIGGALSAGVRVRF